MPASIHRRPVRSSIRPYRPVFGALLAGISLAGAAHAQCADAEFHAADGVGSDGFGRAVAVSGRYVVVGAMLDEGAVETDAGSAYVFEYDGTGFVEQAKLHPPVEGALDYFGYAVAIDGDRALVASKDDQVAQNAGAGFLYERSEAGWHYAGGLFASDGGIGDSLGVSVDLEGTRAVLGAPGLGVTAGAAYVFERDAAGAWSEVAKLEPLDPTHVTRFGRAVALSGERIVVGALGAAGMPNLVYVFERHAGVWTETERIEGDFRIVTHARVLDLEGSTIVVAGGEVLDGRAFVHELVDGQWTAAATLSPSLPGGYRQYGSSVAIDAGRIAVGCTDRSTFGSSQTFVDLFVRDGAGWVLEDTATPGSIGRASDSFGTAVALSPDLLAVGSSSATGAAPYSGAAHAFGLLSTGVTSTCSSTPNSTGAVAGLSLACPSRLLDRLALEARDVPETIGLFAFGTHAVDVPLGNGVRCVGGAVARSPLVSVSDGRMVYELALDRQREDGRLLPGSTWYFQAWFRDPASGGAGTNLSNGLEVSFRD